MKISIVTVVYNRAHCIAHCIESVLKQNHPDIEHIIIDGGSTDGTAEIIQTYQEKLGFFLSEKDGGLYDALNKGIEKVSGEVVGILHSDDIFYDENTINKVAQAFTYSNADLVYAKGVYVGMDDTNRIKRKYPSTKFKKQYLKLGWIPLHTTIFVKRDIFLNYGFYDLDFRISSDYEISLRWFQNEKIQKFFLDEWVVKMRMGGISTSQRLQFKKSKEDLRIIKRYGLNGIFTLACKIGRKVPQYVLPKLERLMRVSSGSKPG